MGITTLKGEIGEAMVIADLDKRGFGVAIPFGHDVPFDVGQRRLIRWAADYLDPIIPTPMADPSPLPFTAPPE